MASQVGVWSIRDGQARRADRSQVRVEIDLEAWIEGNPGLLAEGLTVIGRQVQVEGGIIDLLCVDVQGRIVIVELKRGRLRRKAIAQALDYASSIWSLSSDELIDLLTTSSGVTLDEDSLEAIARSRADGVEIAIIVAGEGADGGLERVAGFLADYDVPIRIVTFEVFELPDGQQLLVREVIEEAEPTTSRRRTVPTVGSRTVDEIGQACVSAKMKDAFHHLIGAAELHGLAVRPYTNTVMVAPPHQRNRYLMAIEPRPDSLRISHGPEAFEEFFPGVTAGEVENLLGPGGYHTFTEDDIDERLDLIDQFLAELPPIDVGDDDRRADSDTIIPLAGVVRRGEWTTYGELSRAATGRVSGAMAVGSIARSNDDFPNPHRVLNARGVPPSNWRSDDGGGPEVCRRRLEDEGVRFDSNGVADPTQRVDCDELVARLKAESNGTSNGPQIES